MSYTVIARRWRPKRLEDVIGQLHIVRTIQNSIKFNRIAHAYLFTGPRGVGKTSMARIIAKAVNCIDGPKEEPCGVCENCISIDNGSFVDVVEIDAASTRGIDDIRELTETVRYMPMKGRYKLYILDEAHMLTPQARDAFLKTLEEPPGNNIFILATTEPQKIPYTIMSRCQRFDFKRISEKDIIDQMKKVCQGEGIEYDEGAFRYVATEADGSMRDAESILDQIIAYSGKRITEKDVLNIIGVIEKNTLHDIVKSIINGDMKLGLETIERVLNEGYDAYHLYSGLISFLRNIMIVKVYDAMPPFIHMGEDEYEKITLMLKDIEYYEIQNMLSYLLKSEDLIKGFFPRISLEVLYINLYNLAKLRDVEKILDNMGNYEQQENREERAVIVHEAERRAVRVERAEQAEQAEQSRERKIAYSKAEKTEKVDKAEEGEKTEKIEKTEKTAKTEPATEQDLEEHAHETQPQRDIKGFVEYLRKKKPFIGSILENLDLKIENGSIIVLLDKNYTFIKNDMNMKEEIKLHLKVFFGTDMGLVFKDSGEKMHSLEDYVKETESLFKI
jgi:DNA polymerase III subunit gamma/tau